MQTFVEHTRNQNALLMTETILHHIRTTLQHHPGKAVPLAGTNNAVYRLTTHDGTFLLKALPAIPEAVLRKEAGMRSLLHHNLDINIPQLVGVVPFGDLTCMVLEFVEGASLLALWRANTLRIGHEAGKLGELLARLHMEPVDGARTYLSDNDPIYTADYFQWMQRTITPFLADYTQQHALEKCYRLVTETPAQRTITHGDFGPHQIIVEPNGRWHLIDFEYASIAPFPDDLSGVEVRLAREKFPVVDSFLAGYGRVRPMLGDYWPVRDAFKAYNLLAMLTYRIDHEANPTPDDLKRLGDLLHSVG